MATIAILFDSVVGACIAEFTIVGGIFTSWVGLIFIKDMNASTEGVLIVHSTLDNIFCKFN